MDGTWKFKFRSYFTTDGRIDLICFNCGKAGHGVRDCKEPRNQARIDKNVAEFREKKQSQGNYRNKGSGGKAGGGYQRKTFTKTTGSEKINNVTPTNNNSKKKGKKAGKLGEATPKDPTPVIGVTQLGEYMQKMVTLSSDPNLAATAQIISDLCQGKV